MPSIVPQRTLRNLTGDPLWVPIGGRMRGINGSGGVYDTTNNSVQDQTSYVTPTNYAVKSIRLAFAGFDQGDHGQVDRVNTISGYAAIYQATNNFTTTTSASSSAGTFVLTFTPGLGITSSPSIGQGVSGSNIPANTYVTLVTPTWDGTSNLTSLSVTVNNAFTGGGISNGQSISFAGQLSPAKFNGLRQFSLEPMHDFLLSDPIDVEIAANTQFYVRVCALFSTSAMSLMAYPTPVSGSTTLTGEASNRSTNLTDVSLSTNTPSNTGGGFFCPSFILGRLATDVPQPSILVIGDSIACGTGDAADASGRLGYVNKSLTNTYNTASIARGGTSASNMQFCLRGPFSAAQKCNATDILFLLGRNDIWNGTSAATLKTTVQTCAAPFIAAGMRVWVVTVPPTTTSTDGWITAANQTIASAGNNTQRNTYNSDLKTNYLSYGYAGVIDVCSSWEDQSNLGKWRTDLGAASTDGVHPAAILHTQAITDKQIPVTRFAA